MFQGYDAWWAASVQDMYPPPHMTSVQDGRILTHKEALALAAPAHVRSVLCFDCLAVAMATQVVPGA